MEWIQSPEIWIALTTLTLLEVVLGIDNVIFISILSGKLPEDQQSRARNIGLFLAMLVRIALLFSLTWLMTLTQPLITFQSIQLPDGHGGTHPLAPSGKDLILIIGGLFLLAKSTFEIHEKLEGDEGHADGKTRATFSAIMVQMVLLNVVFSLDSVITAVGMTNIVGVMIAAVIISTVIMLISALPISNFVEHHPTVKMLALCFLLLIGMSLVAEGLGLHISKGYIYFAMGFSMMVEMFNIRLRKSNQKPTHLRKPYTDPSSS